MSGEGGGHFALELDPEQLDVALAKMQSMGRDFDQRATKLLAMPGDIGDSWTGKAARAAKQEMTGLGDHLQSFSTAMSDSRKAVKKLKATYEEALEKVERLNTQWEAASTTYTAAAAAADLEFERRSPETEVPIRQDLLHGSAKRSARFALESTQNSLVTQFDELRTEVKGATRTCAKALALEVPLPVAPQEVSLYRDFRWTGIRGERDEFTRDMPLSAELDVSDPVDATEGQDAEDKRHKLIKDANTVLRDTALNWKAADTDIRLTVLRAQAAALRREEMLARQVQHARRGTPLGRGAKKNAAEAARKAADIDIEVNRNSYKMMRRLPWVGQGLGIGKDVYDVTTGQESVGKVAVKNTAGVAGGAAAVVLIANPLGLGVVGTAAAGAGAAYALSEAASWAWDEGHIQSATKGTAKQAKKAWKWAFG